MVAAYEYDQMVFSEGNGYVRFATVPLPSGLFTTRPYVVASKNQTGNSEFEISCIMNVVSTTTTSVRLSVNNPGGGLPSEFKLPFTLMALGW